MFIYLLCLSAALLCYTGFQNQSLIRSTFSPCSTCCFGLGFYNYKTSRNTSKDLGHNSRTSFYPEDPEDPRGKKKKKKKKKTRRPEGRRSQGAKAIATSKIVVNLPELTGKDLSQFAENFGQFLRLTGQTHASGRVKCDLLLQCCKTKYLEKQVRQIVTNSATFADVLVALEIRVNLCCLHTLQWFPFCIVLDK